MTLFRLGWEKPIYIVCIALGLLNWYLYIFGSHNWWSLFSGTMALLVGSFCLYGTIHHDRIMNQLKTKIDELERERWK